MICLAKDYQTVASDAQNQADEKARQHLASTLQQEGLSTKDDVITERSLILKAKKQIRASAGLGETI